MYADAQFCTFGVSYEAYYSNYDNSYNDYGLLIGPSLLIGYDWFWGKHVGFNIASGASLDIASSSGIWWAFDGGIIFDFKT